MWAIGTGLTAANDQVESAHEVIGNLIRRNFKNSNHIHFCGICRFKVMQSLIQTKGVDGFLLVAQV